MCHSLSMKSTIFAVLVGIFAALASTGITPSTSQPAPVALTTLTAAHAHYRYPDHLIAARRVCYRAERDARGIPGDRAAYVAWWNAHAGTAERAGWEAAYDACNAAHELPGGKWDWSAMVRVR
jgi:hypothetical protein